MALLPSPLAQEAGLFFDFGKPAGVCSEVHHRHRVPLLPVPFRSPALFLVSISFNPLLSRDRKKKKNPPVCRFFLVSFSR